MRSITMSTAICLLLAGAVWEPTTAHAEEGETPDKPLVERYLIEGRLAAGHERLEKRLEEQPNDQQARFGLGVLQILQAAERLSQSLYRHGVLAEAPQVPFVRIATIPNENPQPLSYHKYREIMQRFVDDLGEAEWTLAGVPDEPVQLPLRIGLVRLDLDGDGKATDAETFWRLFAQVALGGVALPPQQQEFPIGFDTADVRWMRGYCHLLMGMAEAYLAYDSEEFFNHTAHVFFAGAESPYPFLRQPRQPNGFQPELVADLIAAIHLFRWDVEEPQRMRRAHGHLLAMIEQSRACWKLALAETDDAREWIPNPRQTSLMPGMAVTDERVRGWSMFLDEWEAILEGKTLVPHWRIADGRGINLKRVFYEPQPFDAVMWAHGAAAGPYLEEGTLTDRDTWRRLQQTFGGNFLGFAIWFN